MEEASVSIRLNPFKGLDGPAGTPVPWSPYGRILAERPVFTLDPLFHAGCYYVQDSSAMYVGHLFRKLLAIAGGSGQLPPETSGCAGPLPSDDGPLPLTMPPDKDKSPWKGAQNPPGRGRRGLKDKPACWHGFRRQLPLPLRKDLSRYWTSARPRAGRRPTWRRRCGSSAGMTSCWWRTRS